jgi:hypothetical protein
VYSFDEQGRPTMAGLQGLDPVTLQQLGMHAGVLPGIDGLAAASEPTGPQMNATNQTSLALGNAGVGSATPVLGAPIVLPSAQAATAAAAGEQRVTNENVTDRDMQSVSPLGWGYGDLSGGLATPYSPYGPSMTGAYTQGTGQSWLRRWLG